MGEVCVCWGGCQPQKSGGGVNHKKSVPITSRSSKKSVPMSCDVLNIVGRNTLPEVFFEF